MRFKSTVTPGDSPAVDPIRRRGRILRRFLAANSELMELMADLETDLNYLEPGEAQIRQPILRLLEGSLLLAENLNLLTRDSYAVLYDAHRAIEKSVREHLRSSPASAARTLVIPLENASTGRVREVGGKAARLGDLRVVMPDLVPPGFVISTAAYRLFLERNNLHEPIRELIKDLSFVTERDLFRQRTAAIRALLEKSPVPGEVADAIADGIMQFPLPWPASWAVRSSGVGEDGRLSFAGQFDSLLNVPRDELQDAYRKVIASRYTDRGRWSSNTWPATRRRPPPRSNLARAAMRQTLKPATGLLFATRIFGSSWIRASESSGTLVARKISSGCSQGTDV